MTSEEIIIALSNARAARAGGRAREGPARRLEEDLGPAEVVEVFRRVAAREIRVGGFLTGVGECVARADLENRLLMVPFLCCLLVKYETLLEQHRAQPPLKTFPPEG